MSGDLCEGLHILVKCIRNKDQFLADKLQEALKDKDTKTVTRRILGEVNETEIQWYFVLLKRERFARNMNKWDVTLVYLFTVDRP